jgi:hypothetical protein
VDAVAFTLHGWGTNERALNYFDANLGAFYFVSKDRFQDWFDWVISLPLLDGGESYESHYTHHWTLFRLTKKS